MARSPLRASTLALSLLVLAVSASADAPRPLAPGGAVSDTVSPDAPHVFTVELDAGSFLLGTVEQKSVDAVIRLSGPVDAAGEGERLDVVDGSRRGPETFSIRAEDAGTYHVGIEAFGDEGGEYALRLGEVSPIATTPEGTIDQRFARWNRTDGPGVVVGVVDGGELVFSRGYGMANLTHGIPLGPETPSNVGSISKQFTAMALLVLQKEGELSLDDPIRKHLPRLPEVADGITLRHLLHHTSGLREVLNALAMSGWEITDSLDRSEVYALLDGQESLQFEPGNEHVYNNTGYLLLADVVSAVAGERFDDWMAANVFRPLGMTSTFVRQDRGAIIPHAAQGYVRDEDGELVEEGDIEGSWGAGGIYSTPGDLARWLRNFHTDELAGEGTFATFTTPVVLSTGEEEPYALGIAVDEYRGLRRVWHNGGDAAHTAMLAYLPDLDVGVAVLGNTPGFAGMGHAEAVLEAWFDDRLPPGPSDETASEAADEAGAETADIAADADATSPVLDDATMSRYAGTFELVGPGLMIEFRQEDGGLVTEIQGQPTLALVPLTATELSLEGVDGVRIVFHPEGDGPVERATLHQMGEHELRRVAEWTSSAEDLAGLVGRYWSDELEALWTVDIGDDGELQARQRRLPDAVTFQPKDEDTFAGGPPLLEVRFVRGDDGKVTGFYGSFARTRDVWFARME